MDNSFYLTVFIALAADLIDGWLRRFSDRCQRDMRGEAVRS